MRTVRSNNTPDAVPASIISWAVLWIIALGTVCQLVRIASVSSSTGEVPFLSANDRSRWCTIAALAITGSFEIDEIIQIRDPRTNRRAWYSIDMVRHRGRDGQQHYYSSKPPLLPTLYTGVYVAVRAATGATLMRDAFYVARVMLLLVNLLPLLVTWLVAAWCMRTRNNSWWVMLVTISFIVWGCMTSTHIISLNNHLPAAIAVAASLYCVYQVVLNGDLRWRWFVLGGLSVSFAATNELPALSWVAAAGAMLMVACWRRTLLGFVPALIPLAIAFFVTNYWAHGDWKPAYAHRHLGTQLQVISVPPASLERLFSIEGSNDFAEQATLGKRVDDFPSLVEALRDGGIAVAESWELRPARRPGIVQLRTPEEDQLYGLARAGDGQVAVHQWDDWYDYPISYWVGDRKQGVDRGEPSRAVYAFHSLVGHHGIFSLTPFWCISLFGFSVVCRQRSTWNFFQDKRLLLALAVLSTSLVTIGFYLLRPLEDRNYGGVNCGFRWALWLAPLWTWLAVVGLQRIDRSWQRRIVEVLVLASAFSACYPWDNPWTSPWLMQYWEYLRWI